MSQKIASMFACFSGKPKEPRQRLL
jgi:hypothetical protein